MTNIEKLSLIKKTFMTTPDVLVVGMGKEGLNERREVGDERI